MASIDFTKPNLEGFGLDPFGYAALGWHKWGILQTQAGFPVDLKKGPTTEDLKSPVLWMTHARAMSEAAIVLVRGVPTMENIHEPLRGIFHCQYHAVALMLIGYSLEICLKGMLIYRKGIAVYQQEEKTHSHHKLEKLAEFIPNLSAKDLAVLKALTHYIYWAGRYPDPGFGKLSHADEVFDLSEQFQISAMDLFEVAGRVMNQSVAAAGLSP